MTTISFPGLGIEPFSLNKIAFEAFGLEVRWYGVIITTGILFAFLYAFWRGKRNEGIVEDDVIDVGLATVFLGIIGARVYYVLTTLDKYEYNSLYDVIAFWEGGIAIYGGIIGGCLGILLMCRIKKLRWQKLFDMIAPGVVIAQSLGRWGNFFNGEAYGYSIGETTRFYFFNNEYLLPSGEGTLFHTLRMGLQYGERTYYYHPTFFYESVWNLCGFILLNLLYKKKKFDGQVALMYFIWYGFGRMFVEGFRSDSLYIPGTTLRISQCVGFVCFMGGVALLVYFLVRVRRQAASPVAESAAAAVTVADNAETEEAQTEEQIEEQIEQRAEQAFEDACPEEKQPHKEEEDNGKID